MSVSRENPPQATEFTQESLTGLIGDVQRELDKKNISRAAFLIDEKLLQAIQRLEEARRKNSDLPTDHFLRIGVTHLALQRLVAIAAELKRPVAVIRAALGIPLDRYSIINLLERAWEAADVETLQPRSLTGGPMDWHTEIVVTQAKIAARQLRRKDATDLLESGMTQLTTVDKQQVQPEEISDEAVITSLSHLMAYMAILTNRPELLQRAIDLYGRLDKTMSSERLKVYLKWQRQLSAHWSEPGEKIAGLYQRLVG